MRRKRRGRVLLLAASALAAAACGSEGTAAARSVGAEGPSGAAGSAHAHEEDASAFVLDDHGRRLDAARPRRRVVSLVPALTDIVVAIGGADRLVGRTRFDRDPRLAAVPSVGGPLDPAREAVLAARPDLVLAWGDSDARPLVHELGALGVPVYAATMRTIDDYRRHVEALGRLLGREEGADTLRARTARALDALRQRAPAEPPRVLYVLWPRPLTTTGRGTYVDELVRLVGGRGLFDDLAEPWPVVSFEDVLARDPDVVLVATRDAADVADMLRSDPRWRALRAVRDGRIHAVDPDLLNRPGPDMPRAAALIARLTG